MARRIDIELTSAQPDGNWTWRAAGALKPRGVLDGALLYDGAKTGDVVRADAEFEIEGITITAVLPPKEKKRAEVERIEVVGPPRDNVPGVTASLAARSERRRPEGGPRPARRDGDGRGRAGRPPGDRADRPGRPGGQERSGRPASGERRPADGRAAGGPDGGPQPDGARREGGPRRDGPDGPGRERPPRNDARHDDQGRRGRPSGGGEPSRPKARRLSPGNTHRNAVLEGLPPEQRPIAEQVLRGGLPAVRTALHLEREKAQAEGRTAPNSDALLAIAEELLPKLKAAEWRDRAEAASKGAAELTLRDLRSVVAGADVARDDEGRQLAASLRAALEQRIESLRQEWLTEIGQNLTDGRVVRALRLSARPPESSTRLPAEVATQLADASAAAMAPDTPVERWIALIEAVAASPVRRSVKPAGLPADPPEPLLQAARQSAGWIPALAPMLGIAMPPPPRPIRTASRPGRPAPPNRPRPPGAAPAEAPAPVHEAATPEPEATAPTEVHEVATPEPEPSVSEGSHAPAQPEAEVHEAAEPEPEATTPTEVHEAVEPAAGSPAGGDPGAG